ncbi:hypothetical protein ACFLSJ_02290 [Verrucomicrobiota bacterium]
MNKKDVTEAAIKIVAVYMILQAIVRTITSALSCVVTRVALLPGFILPVAGALVVAIFWVVVIRKTDWIISKLYKE